MVTTTAITSKHPNLMGDAAWSQRELNGGQPGLRSRRFWLESDFFNPTPQPCVQQAWSTHPVTTLTSCTGTSQTSAMYISESAMYISDKCHVHLRQVPCTSQTSAMAATKPDQSNILATQFTYSHGLAEHKREGSKLRSVAAVQIRDTFSRKTNCHILVRRRMSINEQNESFTCLKAGRSLLK